MSGTEGKMEGLSSLRKPKKDSYVDYRFRWLKKIVDLVYRPSQPE